jgi:hypothetical protein
MTDDFFGDAKDSGGEQRIIFAVPLHALNTVEIVLQERMIMDPTPTPPMIFLGDDDDDNQGWNADEFAKWFGAPMSLAEASALQDIIESEVTEKYRRQLIIARELGPKATLDLYRLACAIEDVPSII